MNIIDPQNHNLVIQQEGPYGTSASLRLPPQRPCFPRPGILRIQNTNGDVVKFRVHGANLEDEEAKKMIGEITLLNPQSLDALIYKIGEDAEIEEEDPHLLDVQSAIDQCGLISSDSKVKNYFERKAWIEKEKYREEQEGKIRQYAGELEIWETHASSYVPKAEDELLFEGRTTFSTLEKKFNEILRFENHPLHARIVELYKHCVQNGALTEELVKNTLGAAAPSEDYSFGISRCLGNVEPCIADRINVNLKIGRLSEAGQLYYDRYWTIRARINPYSRECRTSLNALQRAKLISHSLQ